MTLEEVAETEDLPPAHDRVHADEVVQVHPALWGTQRGHVISFLLSWKRGLEGSWGHLPCVSGGTGAGASSRIRQGSSCETDQKRSSPGRSQQGSPGTSCQSERGGGSPLVPVGHLYLRGGSPLPEGVFYLW